jgi:2-phospho-L-lactate/phosphoenolpyruvate guanylyltransferase
MITWAAIAFKGTVGGKRRLAGLLAEQERAALGLALLEDVLDAVLAVEAVERVLLVTPAPPTGIRQDARLEVVLEPRRVGPSGGLNAAFELAQARVYDAATGLLLLPADLPLITPHDVEALIKAGDEPGSVLAPDRAAGGTNSMLLRPPAALAPSFGEQSFERHRRLAEQAGLPVAVVRRPGLALDLDVPADVAALLAADADCRARRLLVEIGAERRLDAVLSGQARSATI